MPNGEDLLKINIVAAVYPESKVYSMEVEGAPRVMKDVKSLVRNDDNEFVEEEWTGEIYDDGRHADLAKDDKSYGIQLVMKSQAPRQYQAFFIKYTGYDSTGNLYSFHYPQILPSLRIGSFQAKLLGTFLSISGDPYEGNAYTWAALFFNQEKKLIFSSPDILSEETTYNIPLAALPREKIFVKAVGTLNSRMVAFPDYKVHSIELELDLTDVPY